MNKDNRIRFEVSMEPKLIPGEGRVIETVQFIDMVVFARNINDAITIAKNLVNLNSEDIEVTSACMHGRHRYSV